MSLSKIILYENIDQLKTAVRETPNLDVYDEFGYTPLVETALMNEMDKAQVLLDAGANANFSDLTGRTALHWAAQNNNEPFCRLLLNHHADTNAYTVSGQSVYVMPLLAGLQNIKKLLLAYRAEPEFSRDFILAKSLGHRFSLAGTVDILDHKERLVETEYDGFYPEFTLAMILDSLLRYRNNFAAREMRLFFPYLQTIISAFDDASHLARFQQYLFKWKIDQYWAEVDPYLQSPLLLLPVSFQGHAISIIVYGSWFVRCDRGEFGRDNGTVIVYRMPDPKKCDQIFIKGLLYKSLTREFVNDQLAKQLNLKQAFVLPLPPQTMGNCSWANMEAAVPAILFLLMLQQKQKVVDAGAIIKKVLNFYDTWQYWDQAQTIHQCMYAFEDLSFARQISRASMLMAVLFQCLSADRMKDLPMMEKILKILLQPKFDFIIKQYLKVFIKDRPHKAGANLKAMLEEYGVDPSLY